MNKAERLAQDILTLSRNTLLVHLRFLDMALSMFSYIPTDIPCVMTDGKDIYFHARFVLAQYRTEQTAPVRSYLHMVLHCVFQHTFVEPTINRTLWNLAADIAVENMITELQIPAVQTARDAQQTKALVPIRTKTGMLSAEKVYRYLLDCHFNKEQLVRLQNLFHTDEHTLWYAEDDATLQQEGTSTVGDGEDGASGGSGGSDSEGEDDARGGSGGTGGESGESDTPNASGGSAGGKDMDGDLRMQQSSARQTLAERWCDISERMQMDMESFSKAQGDRAGSMMQNLREVNREKYDFTRFLKKFAVPDEVMKINDDEFDYVFYTYGLQLYENMPLIEPLEYKETKRIREFVIAIDTSGSTAGELVQRFVQKTYNILKSTESFSDRINLHFIQCDAEIQEHVKITSQEEFDQYLKSMRILGLGGTDFRPVFTLVDQLIRDKEFTNLKGMIYFTDGYGTFPRKKPDYDTAFVFIEEGYQVPEVPPWAIRLVLQKEEI